MEVLNGNGVVNRKRTC